MRLMRWIVVLAVSSVLFTLAPRSSADPALDSPAYRARLDGLLAAQDWTGIGAAIDHPTNTSELFTGSHWLEAEVDAGQGGMLLSSLLARDLWLIGNAQAPRLSPSQIDDLHDDLRATAGMMFLYTYELVLIDGATCEDRSAPGHRVDQIMRGYAATFAYLKSRPATVKDEIIRAALGQELSTASKRPLDMQLCSWGMEEFMAGMRAGTEHKLPQPGPHGETIGVAAPPGWKPKFLSPEIYKPGQEKMRAVMPDMLTRLMQ